MTVIDLKPVGINSSLDLSNNHTEYLLEHVPTEQEDGVLRTPESKNRCIIQFKNSFIEGGYGIIHDSHRTIDKYTHECYVKYSKNTKNNLLNEALLQYVSYLTLKKYKIQYMIAEVYDIYKRTDNTVLFSMEKKYGKSMIEFILESNKPELDFINCLIQMCIILIILKKEVYLDHRDLRYTNALVIKKPTKIHFVFDKEYTIKTDYHVCLLDFGFSCIGEDKPTIKTSDDIYKLDKICMKPGRDMFLFVSSFFFIKQFREKLNPNFIHIMDKWFIHNDKNYSKTILKSEELAYMITYNDSFEFNFFIPEVFLSYLYDLRNCYM